MLLKIVRKNADNLIVFKRFENLKKTHKGYFLLHVALIKYCEISNNILCVSAGV